MVVVVVATVAVVAGVALASGALSTVGPDRGGPTPGPTPNRNAGVYDPTPVPPAEVVRRCTEQFISSPDLATRAASGWRLHSGRSRNLRVGTGVTLTAGGVSATCTIPDVDLAIGSGPTSRPIDMTGGEPTVLRECSQVAGYDFSGWTVMTSMAAADGFAAVLRSRNGYLASCKLGPLSDGTRSQQVMIQPAAAAPYFLQLDVLHRDAPEIAPEDRGVVYAGAGMLYDHEGRPAAVVAEVRIALPNGRVVSRPVVNATYAVRVFDRGASADTTVHVTVLHFDGGRLASYDIAGPAV